MNEVSSKRRGSARIKKDLKYYAFALYFTLFFVMPKIAEVFASNPFYQQYFNQFFGLMPKLQPNENFIREFLVVNTSVLAFSGTILFGTILFINLICFVFISIKTKEKLWPSVIVEKEAEIKEKIIFFKMPFEKMTA